MDDETRKVAMLIAAFKDEQARLNGTVEKVARSEVVLQHEVRNGAREEVEAALKELQPRVNKAGPTLVDLQRLSLWRSGFSARRGGRGRHRRHAAGCAMVRAADG